MIQYDLQIKSGHVFLALAVGLVFLAGFTAASVPVLRPLRTPLKYLGWTVDVALLTAAMMLLTILPAAVYANGWLLAKLLLLALFVVCRHFATRETPGFLPRWAWFAGGALVFVQAYAIARAHHPLGALARLVG